MGVLMMPAFPRLTGQGWHCGDLSSPVQLTCEVRGDLSPPIPKMLPKVDWRVGLDLNPIDLRDSESTLWLRALIWPEERDQVYFLQHGIRLAQQNPPELIAGAPWNCFQISWLPCPRIRLYVSSIPQH